MKVKEIKKLLSRWPDDAEVEVAVNKILLVDEPNEPIWASIESIDIPEDWKPRQDEHCLITVDKIVMG